jgi:DNA-binding NarL/FixJ family response regulator
VTVQAAAEFGGGLDGLVSEPALNTLEQVREAYVGLCILANSVDDALLRRWVETICHKLFAAARTDTVGSPPLLGSRELDVLGCVALGRTNGQIPAALGSTLETMKSHLRSTCPASRARAPGRGRWNGHRARRSTACFATGNHASACAEMS